MTTAPGLVVLRRSLVARRSALARLGPMSAPSLPAAGSDYAQVRSQLVTALELDLIGPSQRVLQALGADAEGLETEVLDRLPCS